jgi:hypothetical protein
MAILLLLLQDGLEFFEKRVRPVLVERCYSCHAADAKKLKGGLRLDTRGATLKGGDTGPAVVPGKPDLSLLIKAVRYADDLQMPPKGRLPEAVVADLVRWVEMGAPDPREGPELAAGPRGPTPEEGRKFWAFQPLKPGRPGAGHPIDALLNAKDVAPEADRATLLRRVTFGLTGLPPGPDDGAAWDVVVDRLLASPRYGEKWGRRWLDLMRYADSNGVDEDVNHPNAWRYRDWVIAAFNADLPWPRFVTAQLAGDLLPEPDVVATSWLALGPKMLAEPDLEKMKLDIADEQLDVATKTFLGLTVSCARCHDHKFDPIPTSDYYALAGIFRSTELISDYSKRPAILIEHEVPGGKTLGPREIEPRDLPVHVRGSHLALAKEKTPRGTPKVFETAMERPAKSGRLELAAWLSTNPLAARVLVNRIWQGHFAEGLVRTPSNFGLKGELPTHPELLDWLAAEFMKDGSIKRIHRLILTSAAYRRSSAGLASDADPENRRLAKQNRRRLDAEEIRDALLFVAGSLDLTIGGTVKGAQEGRDYYKGSDELYKQPRRTVYLPVARHKTYDLLQIFDYADTAVHLEKRPSTVVAQQALFMLNNPLVREQAALFAKSLTGTDEEKVRQAWPRLFGRPATADDVSDVLRSLTRLSWPRVVHALMASNDFIYVD